MNKALFDTDIISFFLKGEELVVKNVNLYLRHFGYLNISIITYYEIVSGLLAKKAVQQLNIFEKFISKNRIIFLTESSANIASEIYASLRVSGNTVDDIDLLIAGIAIENELVLITNNEKHFSRIHNLKIENWRKIEIQE
ncbi:type II toxin-antitoxin system VapC family toxin [Aquiflexum lacus]|uniref:type II toxin-antitoxin system VapC family toxin n=1 Tax=Aquiflexum lacus TaxID=2483805 RepID=UPI00189414D2|nr:type II toxin-antitoxin system VapC family toxin [Aquiflexum lacus]